MDLAKNITLAMWLFILVGLGVVLWQARQNQILISDIRAMTDETTKQLEQLNGALPDRSE